MPIIDPGLVDRTIVASDVVPGNIYAAMGGKRNPGTSFWIVMACSERAAHLLGIDSRGEIVSTSSYIKSALQRRPVLGRVDVSAVRFPEKT